MGYIVFAILLLLAAIGAKFVAAMMGQKIKAADAAGNNRGASYSDMVLIKTISRWVFRVAAIAVVTLTLFYSFAQVSTKNIGVVTSFGKTFGFLGNGPHLIWPWENVTEMDAAIQTDSYTDKPGDEDKGD